MGAAWKDLTPVIVAVIGAVSAYVLKRMDRPRPDRPGGRARPRRRAGILFYLALAMVAGGVAGYAVPRMMRWASPPGPSAPALRITAPSTGSRVEMVETIRGTSRGLPAGDSIWVVVYIPSKARFYPQDHAADVQVGGGWNGVARIGVQGDAGLRFEVLAVDADAATRAAFHAYLDAGARIGSWPGMDRLPPQAREYDRVAVTRLN